ncbi:endosome/lysosome-associated apoptosis and autophagy regulator family member 2-like isoform X2 [Dreissena polymorpha]|uniref:endosome/lysosome-associated apoptosis and autophagy regulator family member 2-like isoform X2 n=1 Tax=Dreissena polymorpha TaxID=45954 RepID=UPI0022650E31|nr:endosome/lysosome-associated apoptosis and autophagy regulator family member 2-like isoform X2 [Dreissena polymorpha]
MAKLCFIAIAFLAHLAVAEADTCTADDYEYQYTQCDEEGHRWRVSVPSRDCTPGADHNDIPRRGLDCDFECPVGHYLDMASQQCKNCAAGTYSSGSSAQFDDWEKLPAGFSVSTESLSSWELDSEPINCSMHAWTPKGSYVAVLPSECVSKLVYSVSLVKAGHLTFQYQNPGDSAMLFHVNVQNDQCQSANDKDSTVYPKQTNDGSWKSATVKLKSGFNVITWYILGMEVTDDVSPVLVRDIHVTGAAYTSDCSKCPAGTYSSEGAEMCSPCPINTACKKGTQVPERCESETQYAPIGSSECKTRPACSEVDFYQSMKPCVNNKTAIIYSWIEPRICNPTLPGSTQLPAETASIDCMACNPGMYLDPASNTCTYCPENHRSDGQECVACATNTAPDYGYSFVRWNSIPQGIKTMCIPFSADECSNDTKWLTLGDHVETHFARGESAYLLLQLAIPGFRTQNVIGEGRASSVGQLKIDFETNCRGFCQFALVSNETGKEDIIQAWNNKQGRQQYVYNFKQNDSVVVSMAFQNRQDDDLTSVNNSTIKIYAVEVTNTVKGGASTCRPCPKGTDQNGCIPCPDGHYIDVQSNSCVQCPPRTVVSSHNAYGAESCKPCGWGLMVYKGRACMSDGNYTDDMGHNFDLKNLSTSFRFLQGSLLFTSTGTQYYHGFNISLFGEPDKSFVVCENNVTTDTDDDKTHIAPDALQEPKQLVAKICRSTLVPATDSNNSKAVMATQSVSLGDYLVEIVRNKTVLTIPDAKWSTYRDLYQESGFEVTGMDGDVQVHYQAFGTTKACPNGRHTLISLRCDFEQKGEGQLKLPPKCSDGTCNGCVFHFLWLTRLACPVCRKEDFNRVEGVCKAGYQTIHYISTGNCIVPDYLLNINEEVKCTMQLISALPFLVQIAIPVVCGIVLICFMVACILWRKNKKLAYRYMKLVENSQTGEVELPGADSCGLEEDEDNEDGDSVTIRGSKGARFFKKLSNKIKKIGRSDNEDAFESAVLNERMPLT